MKIKLKIPMAGPLASWNFGAILDVDDPQGQRLIDADYAEKYDGPEEVIGSLRAPPPVAPEVPQEPAPPAAEAPPAEQPPAAPPPAETPPVEPAAEVVEIPDDWRTAHHLTIISLGKKFDAAVVSKDDAIAAIEAELARRAA